MNEMTIQLLLVGGNPDGLDTLSTFLKEEPDFSLTGVATWEEALKVLKHRYIDVVLLNATMTSLRFDILDMAIDMLDGKPIKIIMLASVDDEEMIVEALMMGILNYINLANVEEMASAVRDAHHNRLSLHRDAAALLLKELDQLKRQHYQCLLTPREKDILQLIGEGYTRKMIAQALNMAPATVKSHIRRTIKKVGGATGKEVAKKVRRRGLLQPHEQ